MASNFQRSRSKVWWGGDSPPNVMLLGSPVAQASNRRHNNWEPQLPRWAPPIEEVEEVASPPQPQAQQNVSNDASANSSNGSWAAMMGGVRNSPGGSHKSQDSGFSDSDSSPQQQNAQNDSKENKSPKKQENELNHPVVATPKSAASNKFLLATPKSVIKTPKDLQDYLQACCEVGHSVESLEPPSSCHVKKNLFKEFERSASSNVEYVQISPSQRIVVNNQPRARSPIGHDDMAFHRNGRLNRSFDYGGGMRRLDEQILDDDNEGPHSLSCVEAVTRAADYTTPGRRKIMDSLNLKTPNKKLTGRQKTSKGSKGRQLQAQKLNKKAFFNFLPIHKRNEQIKTIYDIAQDVEDAQQRVPSLGLIPLGKENYDEMATDESKSPKGILKCQELRKITPPLQFQDRCGSELKRDTENAELDEIDFCESDVPCTSTPKGMSVLANRSCAKIRPLNLLENFNNSIVPQKRSISNGFTSSSHSTPLERISSNQSAPVKHWLCEQIGSYEPECMTTLQSKSIGVELAAKVTNSSNTIIGNIRKVQTYGQIIVHQYNQISSDIKNTSIFAMKSNNGEIKSMVANINEFVLAHSITLKIKPPGETPERWDKIKVSLQNNIQKVSEITEDITVELNETNPELNVLQNHLKTILDIFIETGRAVLVQKIRTLVTMLEEPPSDMILKSTLTSLGHLGAMTDPEEVKTESSPELMKLFTKLPFVECGVPRALLSVIIETNKSSIKALSLRALATICVTSEATDQFEEAGGIEIVSDILNDHSNPEPQMREAITVLIQITAPWLQGEYSVESLYRYLDKIVKNVTELLAKTSCCQLLLLCTACLVNLVTVAKKRERRCMSSMDNEDPNNSDIIEILSRHKTIEQLLEAIKNRGPNISVFLQEQTAAFINIISTSSKGQVLLAACPATTVALVCFLRAPCPTPSRTAHLQSEFRLINQAAEALAKICQLPEVTAQVIQLEGITRLVRVIQAQKSQKTNGKCSDQILVNCLRALRYVAKNHANYTEYADCDIANMIKPPLMESVKMYSAKQESYV